MKQIINLIGLAAMGLVAWFFWGKREEVTVVAGDEVTIEVAGGDKPAKITVKRGKSVTLKFHRTDPSDCLAEVVLTDFKIRQALPLNETTAIRLKPEKAGEYDFACGMNMFHGKLKVV